MTYISHNTKHNRMAKEKKKVVDKIADKVVEISETIGKKAMEEPFFQAKPVKQLQSLGDATFCSVCSSNTKYKSCCAVCGIPSDENALRYRGNLEFLRVKYPQYIK